MRAVTGASTGSATLVPYRPSIKMHVRLDGSAVVLPALESASRRATRAGTMLAAVLYGWEDRRAALSCCGGKTARYAMGSGCASGAGVLAGWSSKGVCVSRSRQIRWGAVLLAP